MITTMNIYTVVVRLDGWFGKAKGKLKVRDFKRQVALAVVVNPALLLWSFDMPVSSH
jgi:hypothetical protein